MCKGLPRLSFLLIASMAGLAAWAAPVMITEGGTVLITGDGYRVRFVRGTVEMTYELRSTDGQWKPAVATSDKLTYGLMNGDQLLQASKQRATWTTTNGDGYIAISRQMVLGLTGRIVLDLECLCTDSGVLMGYRIDGDVSKATFWCPPRMALTSGDWDEYAFYAADGQRHSGKISSLQPTPAYAGVSPWGAQGDTVARLDDNHPALIVRSVAANRALGIVFVDYDGAWQGASSFLQQHTPGSLLLYCGYSPAGGDAFKWAWLAPIGSADPAAEATRVADLVKQGETLVKGYQPPAQTVSEDWLKPLPDFPVALRRPQPVKDINDAVVYTVNEDTNTADGVAMAAKAGSDVLIRGWFKWGQAPPVNKWAPLVDQIHAQGALFGGGITCSALYDNENGLTKEQVLDMATRGPAGQLVDAWDNPGVRHGSLSCPAYRKYLLRWCNEQIDAGVDYLFMDESNAAISETEGYDDYSLRDFRQYLLGVCPQTRGLGPRDARWGTDWGISLADPQVCPTGDMTSFDYRAYMKALGVLDKPVVEKNRLAALWWPFRAYRDDKAWREITDAIRAYGRERRRTILISGNGIVPYVDLQVLGVWDRWLVKGGHVDLSDNQVPYWRSLVERGRKTAGKRVPVVLFHDWGFGEPPFPWMAVAPSEREIWMRTRGAEIYAAGGFFAFPVLGPFGCNAAEDATLPLIARQTAFYQSHRDLYLQSRWVGCQETKSSADKLSLAAWWSPKRQALVIHAINRDPALQPRTGVTLHLPIGTVPTGCTVVSPDYTGEQAGTCRKNGDGVDLTLSRLEAYSVAILTFGNDIDLSRLTDPTYARPTPRWARPEVSEFRVRADGSVDNDDQLSTFLQGMLHKELRNPPTFIAKALGEGRLEVHVRAVATAGARLEYRIDGKLAQSEELPDRDGKNDGNVQEYDQTYTFVIPAGEHRLTVDNTGGDWAVIDWYGFRGKFGD